jgi:hypothetical protein
VDPDAIIGPEVSDQAKLRPERPVRDLDEFLEFLANIEAVFGPIERPARISTGAHFLL